MTNHHHIGTATQLAIAALVALVGFIIGAGIAGAQQHHTPDPDEQIVIQR